MSERELEKKNDGPLRNQLPGSLWRGGDSGGVGKRRKVTKQNDLSGRGYFQNL